MQYSKTLILAFAAAGTLAFGQADTKVGWSTGYYAGWAQGSYPATKINWKAYTHMCHFSATPTAQGGVNLSMGINDGSAKTFVAEAHKNKVKAILCVGGAGTGSQFQAASGDANTRATLVKNIIALMQKYGYDGVDMDWEEIGGKEASYQALHKDLRTELDKITPRPLLTVAMANYIANACGPVYAVFDQMNNMCYWTHASGLANDFKSLVAKGIPTSKMGVGIGFDYEEGNPEVDCDPTSVKQKCDWALANKYGGVMVWAIEKDSKRYNGSEPSHAALIPYVPLPGTTRLAGPSFAMARQEALSMTIAGNARMGKPVISYMIPTTPGLAGAVVELGLYGQDGRMVRTLVRAKSLPGAYSVALDGAGPVRPGAYIVKLSAGSDSRTAQAFIVK
jgi:chitinase